MIIPALRSNAAGASAAVGRAALLLRVVGCVLCGVSMCPSIHICTWLALLPEGTGKKRNRKKRVVFRFLSFGNRKTDKKLPKEGLSVIGSQYWQGHSELVLQMLQLKVFVMLVFLRKKMYVRPMPMEK